METQRRLYSLALRAVGGMLPLFSRGEGKLARGVRGRRGVLERMRAWAEAERDPSRPLIWFHAPSVGEGLQAAAVMGAFRERRPEAQMVYTFFSPSAEGLAARMPADFADYLPLDGVADVRGALGLLRPDAIAFSKYDVWPNLVAEARERGTRVVLLSGTLPASSSRLRGPARALLRGTYARLDEVGAISAADAGRFGLLGVASNRVSVMGDARFDQVAARAAAADRGSPLLRRLADPSRRTLVAGSTWPADEARLLAAWSALGPGSRRMILVPHEPSPVHLTGAEASLRALGLSVTRLSDVGGEPPGSDVLLVDRLGVLGELYALADVAYVGGGWGKAGIHSVLEPAAYGVPVLYGPRHDNAREAAELVAAGGAFAVSTTADLTARLGPLLHDEPARRTAGGSARRYVESGLGAARAGAEIIERQLDREEGRGKREERE